MSEATVISLVPFPLNEFKPGIYPGFFHIPAVRSEMPEILNIGDSICHVEIDEDRTITVKCTAEDVAKSIVEDYVISNLAFSAEKDAVPGLFWKPGKLTLRDILSKYSEDLKIAKERQRRWFIELIKAADDDWEKTQQHKFISDIQRYAARTLGLERPWIIVDKSVGSIKCPSCQSFISPESVVCHNCRCIINLEKYKTLQFAEAK